MSIQHTVAFRLRHEPGSAGEGEFLEAARHTLSGIPGVGDFVVNRQIGAKSDLRWQFSMVFADQAAYDAYTAHPDHVAFVARRWEAEVEAFQELDLVPEA